MRPGCQAAAHIPRSRWARQEVSTAEVGASPPLPPGGEAALEGACQTSQLLQQLAIVCLLRLLVLLLCGMLGLRLMPPFPTPAQLAQQALALLALLLGLLAICSIHLLCMRLPSLLCWCLLWLSSGTLGITHSCPSCLISPEAGCG